MTNSGSPRLPGRGDRHGQRPDQRRHDAFAEELARLDTIQGVNKHTDEVLVAELGVDMTVFPIAKHLASGAGRSESLSCRGRQLRIATEIGSRSTNSRWMVLMHSVSGHPIIPTCGH